MEEELRGVGDFAERALELVEVVVEVEVAVERECAGGGGEVGDG